MPLTLRSLLALADLHAHRPPAQVVQQAHQRRARFKVDGAALKLALAIFGRIVGNGEDVPRALVKGDEALEHVVHLIAMKGEGRACALHRAAALDDADAMFVKGKGTNGEGHVGFLSGNGTQIMVCQSSTIGL